VETHKTGTSAFVTNSTVVSRDSVRIPLLIAALNELDVFGTGVLMYVDDILAISCDAKAISQDVQRTFELKNDRIDTSEFYLGAKLQEKPTNGLKCWTMTSRDYVNAAVENTEETLRGTRRQSPTSNADTLMNNAYSP
jgi:hypothetical protein